MKKINPRIWISIFSIIGILYGFYGIYEWIFSTDDIEAGRFLLNVFMVTYIFFLIGGLFLIRPKKWTLAAYMCINFIATCYYALITLTFLLAIIQAKQEIGGSPSSLFVMLGCLGIIPPVFYWIITMIYVWKTKGQFE